MIAFLSVATAGKLLVAGKIISEIGMGMMFVSPIVEKIIENKKQKKGAK